MRGHLLGVRRIWADITNKFMVAVRRFREIGRIGFLAEPVPLRCERTASADLLEGSAQSTYAREKVDEAEAHWPLTGTARVGDFPELVNFVGGRRASLRR